MTSPLRRPARTSLAALLRDRKGATAIEYGIVVALIAIAILVALMMLSGETKRIWGNIHTATKTASGS